MKTMNLFIGGEWLEGSSGKYIKVENPATMEIIGQVPEGERSDVDKAVEVANQAFVSWRKKPVSERKKYLFRMAEYFDLHTDEIAETVTEELGTPVSIAAEYHVESIADEIRYFAEAAENLEYEADIDGGIIMHEPIGVVAGLTPWNFPLEQIAAKAFPAMAVGNCVIIKPSQLTPLTAGYFAKAAEYANLPAGVFNLVTGKGSVVGNLLATHEGIRMISFTGSTTGGQEVGRNAMSNIKKIALELGGKSPAIILPGADYEKAVEEVLDNCFMNTGQVCSALTRMIIPEKDKKIIEEIAVNKAAEYKVGDPKDSSTDIGPLVSRKQFDKVKEYIRVGIDEGARMIFGSVPENCEDGYYVTPVIFSDVTNSMRIAREEIFGPVVCIITYETVEEAVDIANDSPYGLSGAVFGEKLQAIEIAKKIEAGTVHINGAEFAEDGCFGGYKESGIGREFGNIGMTEYLETKTIFL